ncbi:MAG TPA: SLC13 family permease [Kofleriaceae bacterium]|nr:SLC13 family permease [Kofleriaceae bacterium]
MLLVAIFVVGYLAIVFEHPLSVNKAASALLAGVLCWTAYVLAGDAHAIDEQLLHHMGELSQILFFLLGAMTIVELIDAHDGFELITSQIKTRDRRRLLVTIALFAFFLSAVLDNLTTSIVMMSLVRRLVPDDSDRRYFAGIVIVAANSGGVWSPIGDVTTTMLWVGGQITTVKLASQLFVPALASIAVPLLWIGVRLKGSISRPAPVETAGFAQLTGIEAALPNLAETPMTLPADAAAIGKSLAALNLRVRTGAAVVTISRDDGPAVVPSPTEPLRAGDTLVLTGSANAIAHALALLIAGRSPEPTARWERRLVLSLGIGVLLFVPVFKTLTQLPPFMGMLLGLGVLWTVTELLHKRKNDEGKGTLSVAAALQRVDAQSVLFFLGILLAISALQSDGLLTALARQMDAAIGNVDVITMSIGLSSSVVDNVPLVAAAQGMYTLAAFPTDHHFWLFLAFCAGTGGSILIIGSAAGVAVMGIQRITFGWYVRHISFPALLGYAAGALTYLALAAARASS